MKRIQNVLSARKFYNPIVWVLLCVMPLVHVVKSVAFAVFSTLVVLLLGLAYGVLDGMRSGMRWSTECIGDMLSDEFEGR